MVPKRLVRCLGPIVKNEKSEPPMRERCSHGTVTVFVLSLLKRNTFFNFWQKLPFFFFFSLVEKFFGKSIVSSGYTESLDLKRFVIEQGRCSLIGTVVLVQG